MSNVVDSKVVELQFENKDFEKNATQSISTLKELKENLNFTGTTKGLEDINSSIKAVNFDNLTNGIKEATNGFSVMETIAFGVFNRLGARIADFGINTIGKLFTYIPNKVFSGGFRRAANVDKAEFMLEGMGIQMHDLAEDSIILERYLTSAEKEAGKAGKAFDTLYDDINSAVSGTAFGYDSAAKAASQLAASGVQVGNEMRATLQGISGVAAMTGATYDEIAYVFTKVAASGKAMNGELRMLSDRGLPVTATIAKYMNDVLDGTVEVTDDVAAEIREISGGLKVTEGDVVDFASKSKISFGIFRDALFSAYSDQAFKANETYEGVITNIGAQLARIGEIFADPFREDAIPVLQKVYDIIKKVRDLVAESAFAAGVIAAMKTISDGLVFVLGKVDAFLEKAKEIQAALDLKGKIKDLFGLGGAEEEAEEAADKIAGSFETVRDTAFKVIKGDYGNGMERMNKLTEEGFDAESIQKYVNALWEVSGHDWSKIFDEDIQKQAADLVGLGEGSEAAGKGINFLNKQLEDSDTAFENMSVGEKAAYGLISVFTGLRAAFEGIRKAFREKVKLPTFDGILESLSTKFAQVSKQFGEFTTKHADDIGNVFAGIANAVLMVVGVFKTLIKIVGIVIGVALAPLVGLVGGIVYGILQAATAVHNWAAENKILEQITTKVNKTLTNARAKVEGWWAAFKQIPGINNTITKFKTAFTDAFENAPVYLTKTKDAIVRFGARAKNAFKLLWNKKISPAEFFDRMKRAWQSFTGTVSGFQFVKDIQDAFSTAKDAVTGWVKSLGDNEDGTRNWFGVVTDTVSSGATWITEKLTGAWTKVREFFEKYKLGDFFSSNFDTIKNAFSTFFSRLPGFASGLKAKWQEFLKKVTDLGGFKFENLGQIWQAFQDTVGQYWTNHDIFAPIKTAFETMKTSAKEKLKEMGIDVDAIIENVKSIPEKLKAYFTDENGKVSFGAGVSKMFESIKEAFSTGKKDVEGESQSIFDMITAIPSKIAAFFTDKNGNVSITAAISNLFSLIVDALTRGKEDVETEGGGVVDTLLSIPTKIVEFFTGWSIPDGFNSLINMFNTADKATNDPQLQTNLTSAGDGLKAFCDKVKEGASQIDWGTIGLIGGAIATLFTVGSAVKIVHDVRGVVEALTNTFGAKAEARNLTATAVLKVAGGIAIVSLCVGMLKKMFVEDTWNTGAAILAVTGIGLVLTGLLGIANYFGGGKLAALTGLGMTLEGIGIGLVVKALKELDKANVSQEAVTQAGVMAAVMEAIAVIGGAAGPAALIGAAAELLAGVGFKALTEAMINLANTINVMKDLTADEAIAAAGNFVDTADALFKGLADLEIDTSVEDRVKRLSNIISVINGLGAKTTWMNLVGGIPQINLLDTVKGLFGLGLPNATESNAKQAETTAKEVAGVIQTWNKEMEGVTLDVSQVDAVEQLVRVFGQIQDFGWTHFLFGAAVPGTFVDSMNHLASGVNEFYTVIDKDFDADKASSAADVVYSLSRLADVDISGSGNFKDCAEDLANGVNTFVGALEDIKDPELAKTAADLASALAALMDFTTIQSLFSFNEDPNGWMASQMANEAGEEITAFDKLGELTTRITQFVQDLSTIEGLETTTANIGTIAESVDSLTTIKLSEGDLMIPSVVETFTKHIDDIVAAMNKAAMSAFMTSAGIDKLKENMETISSTKLTNNDDAASSGADAAGAAVDEIAKSKSSFNDAMGEAIGGAIDAINGASGNFSAAGFGLAMQVALGMRKAKSNVDLAASAIVDGSEKGIRNKRTDFYSAGSYVAQGFADGMRGKYSEVWNKAVALAKQALDAIRKTTKEASPSKVTHQMGLYVGEGFVNGISEYAKRSYDAGKLIADEARKGVQRAVRTINRVVSGDMDATPVIRPVLDLSEIQNGAASISSMLNTNPSLALAGNLTAINSNLLSRTDPNADVIDAIDSLKSTIASTPRTVNNINGVTYDDGSNITSAIETIVHAARVERRV